MKQLLITIAAVLLVGCGKSEKTVLSSKNNPDPSEEAAKGLEDLAEEIDNIYFEMPEMPEMPEMTMPKMEFEYTVLYEDSISGKLDDSFIRKMNDLGKNEWSLVKIESVIIDGNTTSRIYFFMKTKIVDPTDMLMKN